MKTLQELLDCVAADLNLASDYTAQMSTGGYQTPNDVRQADNAEQLQRACVLRLGRCKWHLPSGRQLVDLQGSMQDGHSTLASSV